MAHDFMITEVLNAKVNGDPMKALDELKRGRHAVFFGYGEAAMYKAFNAQQFDAGVSGSFGGKFVTKKQAVDGLTKAIELLASYPDPTRADDIKAFLADVVLPAPDAKYFYIHYS